jgi:outer membrane protein assembly factor BamA
VSVDAPEDVSTSELELELLQIVNDNTNAKTPILGYTAIHKYYKFQEKKAKNPEKYEEESKGEEPIFFDDQLVESVDRLLENRSAANGYFDALASYELDTNRKAQEITVSYRVDVGAPYRLDSVAYYITDTGIARHIEEMQAETFLKPGVRYDLNTLKNERTRIQEALREIGYFYFLANDIEYLADTLGGNRRVDLLMKLKPETEPLHFVPQRITQVDIYPNLEDRDSLARGGLPNIEFKGLSIHCKDCPIRAKVLDEAIAMRPNDLYAQSKHRKTLRRLSSYNTFRYIALDYKPVAGSDSLLKMTAFLEPLLKRRIEAELGISYNNARYFGPEVAFAYTNRNIFRGAELFRLEGKFTYALFLGNEATTRIPSSSIYGVKASLDVPRLYLPRRRKLIPRVITSGTSMELGVRVEQVQMNLSRFTTEIEQQGLEDLSSLLAADSSTTENISLRQFFGQFGYYWQRRTNKSHRLYPFSVRFQNPSVREREILELSRNLGITQGGTQNLSRFDRMLLWSPNYTLTLDSRLDGLKKNNWFWQQYISFNVNRVTPIEVNSNAQETELSLYPQVETDLRYYRVFNRNQIFAARVHGGIAYALSDRAIVPYFEQYTIGGPNSLRGFIPRQLGPGRTVPIDNNLLSFGGYGNVILEGSVEFRQKLDPIIEIAAFADAGNIWTYKTELDELSSDFRTSTFLSEIAVDAGIGLRLDFEFLILRIDLAKPLVIPYEDAVNELPDPGSAEVDRSLKFILAFGHPF